MRQSVDQPTAFPPGGLPDNWWTFPAELEASERDILITKRQWNAFYGTELDLQLRRRGVQTIVLGGISTNIGVESTARAAFEHNYSIVFAEDAMGCASTEQHEASDPLHLPAPRTRSPNRRRPCGNQRVTREVGLDASRRRKGAMRRFGSDSGTPDTLSRY
ncbi:isochorismatase family protein [Trinickia sp. NRRL B-1857]|uniref:isochorismatase family protein n=1 Tax=Trinickia sp. NRRL B-1857 TaxID=3162879 RepID=UPI003D2AE408